MRGWLASIVVLSVGMACGGSTSDDPGATGGSSGVGGSSGAGGSSGIGGSAGVGGTGAVYNWEACGGPGECTVFATNCCGGYCQPSSLSVDWIPVNTQSLGVVQTQYCADPVACPKCINVPEPNYLAVCRAGECTAIDLRQDAISACTNDTDCKLRYGTSCCENCNPISNAELVAVAVGKLEPEVCSPFEGDCPPCAPPGYPPEALAQCVGGHCQVVWATDPGG